MDKMLNAARTLISQSAHREMAISPDYHLKLMWSDTDNLPKNTQKVLPTIFTLNQIYAAQVLEPRR